MQKTITQIDTETALGKTFLHVAEWLDSLESTDGLPDTIAVAVDGGIFLIHDAEGDALNLQLIRANVLCFPEVHLEDVSSDLANLGDDNA